MLQNAVNSVCRGGFGRCFLVLQKGRQIPGGPES